MKPILFSLLLALSAACAGSETPGDTANAKTVQVDKDEGATPAASAPSCDQEIALDCAEGASDGCGITDEDGHSLTLSHLCVLASESFAAPPCEQEIARVCEEGFIDACLLTPAASTVHVCVVKSAEILAPTEESSGQATGDEATSDEATSDASGEAREDK